MKYKTNAAVREIMKQQGIGVNALASMMGKDANGKDVPSRRISERLSQDNISIKVLDQMLRVLRYKIVLLPRDAEVPSNGFEIE